MLEDCDATNLGIATQLLDGNANYERVFERGRRERSHCPGALSFFPRGPLFGFLALARGLTICFRLVARVRGTGRLLPRGGWLRVCHLCLLGVAGYIGLGYSPQIAAFSRQLDGECKTGGD